MPQHRPVTVSEHLARGKPVRIARRKVTSAKHLDALGRTDVVDPGATDRVSMG